jgi:predicted nucleic acid-binding protein
MIASGAVSVCFDTRIIAEYQQVLRRPKFDFDPEYVAAFLNQLRAEGYETSGRPLRRRLPDPDDEPFLEVAVAARAECLITGNLTHFPPASREGIRVLTPAEFLEFYRRSLPAESKE